MVFLRGCSPAFNPLVQHPGRFTTLVHGSIPLPNISGSRRSAGTSSCRHRSCRYFMRNVEEPKQAIGIRISVPRLLDKRPTIWPLFQAEMHGAEKSFPQCKKTLDSVPQIDILAGR